MDLKNMLNDDPVDPSPRRFSSSHDSAVGRNDSVSGRTDSIVSMPGPPRKRSRSPSEAAPSPKRAKSAKVRPTEVPMWARKWTTEWHRMHGGKTNGHAVKPTPSPRPASGPAPVAQRTPPAPAPQHIAMRPSTAASNATAASLTTNAANRKNNPVRPEYTYKDEVPMDQLSRTVMDFIYSSVIQSGLIDNPGPGAEIEIEAKIGTIIDKQTDDRITSVPVLNECALDHGLHIAFRSSMTDKQHQKMNQHLNSAVQNSLKVGSDRQKMKYVHLRERDKFYQLPADWVRGLPPLIRDRVFQARIKPRVRLTFDQKSGELIASIVKVRWADLHVYSPKTMFDWRISISVELRFDGDAANLHPVAETHNPATEGRAKDRLSYEHQGIKIDLTQVTMGTGKEHELEFELPADILRDEARKLQSGEENDYQGLIQNFVDDIRVATREFPR